MPPIVTTTPTVPDDAEVLAVPVASGPALVGDGHGLDLDHLAAEAEGDAGEGPDASGGDDSTSGNGRTRRRR